MGKFKLKRKTFGWKGWTAGLGVAGLAAGATMNIKDKADIITGDVNSNSGKGLGTGYVLGGLGAGALAVAGLAKGGAGLKKLATSGKGTQAVAKMQGAAPIH